MKKELALVHVVVTRVGSIQVRQRERYTLISLKKKKRLAIQ